MEKNTTDALDVVRDLYQTMKDENVLSLEWKEGDRRIKLSRVGADVALAAPMHVMHAPSYAAAPAAAATPAAAPSSESAVPGNAVTAPLAGVFYRAASPGKPAFVKENDSVEAGQTLCIIEAMKVMNEIKAEKTGTVSKIIAENSKAVQAGDPLFIIS